MSKRTLLFASALVWAALLAFAATPLVEATSGGSSQGWGAVQPVSAEHAHQADLTDARIAFIVDPYGARSGLRTSAKPKESLPPADQWHVLIEPRG